MADTLRQFLGFVRSWLLNPHPRVTNPEKIQRSRLLSVILLVLIVLIVVILYIVIKQDPRDINEPTVRGAFLLTGIIVAMYVLNRLGETSIAALGFILPFVAIFIYIPFYSGESPIFLAFLMVPIILTAIFFSVRRTLIFSIGTLVLVGILLSLADQSRSDSPYWNLRNMWFFLLIATSLVLTFMMHLGNLEQIRQTELKQINEELERDIRLRIKAEDALRHSEARLRALVENSPDFILELDRAGDIQFINRREEIYLQKNMRDFLPVEQRDKGMQVIEHVFETGHSTSIELQTISPNGDVTWDSVRLGPVKHGDIVTSLTVILTEITERKRVEAEREALIRELGNRNAELERFTYTVSHELKSPVVTIGNFLGLLKSDLEAERQDKAIKNITRIENAAEKLSLSISDLLELSRVGRIINPPTEVDLAKLVQDALETVDGQLRTLHVAVDVAPDLPIVYGDDRRLREVFENLIINAAKYMGNQKSPRIEIGMRSGDETVFYVRDNGIGIESQYQTKIFGLFEKLNPNSEGTGIGLALVKRIIETHGGRIWVESEGLGKGSTFYFSLPVNRK